MKQRLFKFQRSSVFDPAPKWCPFCKTNHPRRCFSPLESAGWWCRVCGLFVPRHLSVVPNGGRLRVFLRENPWVLEFARGRAR